MNFLYKNKKIRHILVSYFIIKFYSFVPSRVFFKTLWLLFGPVLLSQFASKLVPSPLGGLTSVFGMDTGVSLLPSEPYFKYCILYNRELLLFLFTSQSNKYFRSNIDVLVSISLNDCSSFTFDLSTM